MHARALAASPQHATRACRLGTPPASTAAATTPLLPLVRCPLPLWHLTRPLRHKEADNTMRSHLPLCRLPHASLLSATLALCAALLLRARAHPTNRIAPTHESASTSPLRCSSSAMRLLSSDKPHHMALASAALPSYHMCARPVPHLCATTAPGQAPAATTSSRTLAHAPPHLAAPPAIARPLLPPSSTGRAVAFPQMPCVRASI
jgi:hypothetical protein